MYALGPCVTYQYIMHCFTEEDEDMLEAAVLEDSLKIIVPEGMVVALDANNPDTITWKHKVRIIW